MTRPVDDVDAWFALTIAEQRAFAEGLSERLGAAWQLEPDLAAEMPVRLAHLPTRSSFVIVPGGVMQMGLRLEEVALLRSCVGSRPHVLESIRSFQQYAEPVCEVRVLPFLCGERLLEPDQIDALSPHTAHDTLGAAQRAEALRFCAEHGFRLPSDAELEWLARQGRSAAFVLEAAFEAPPDDEENVLITDQPIAPRFGVADLFTTQWAADDWFPDHSGRPATSVARHGGDAQGVRRFEELDLASLGSEALLGELSARRDPGGKWRARLRFALDLPEF